MFHFEIVTMISIALFLFSTLSLQGVASSDIVLMPADKEKGFHSPYFLAVPDQVKQAGKEKRHSILVVPNNTGTVNDDPAFHEQRARRTIEQASTNMAGKFGMIVLVPVFPRSRTDWRVYTQALDRDTMLSTKEALRRPDLQLVAMIDHAIAHLKTQDIQAESKVFLFGFSASGMFTNRFTFLHPERVKAAAFGSPGGWPLAPVAQEQGKTLRYPIGTGDWETVAGKPFNLKALADVPLFVFVGDEDNNDSVIMRDSYESEDEKVIAELFGTTPITRWPSTERLYRQHLPNATVKLYPGVAHTVSKDMMADIMAFFGKHLK